MASVTESVKRRLKPYPPLYWLLRRVRLTLGALLPPQRWPGIPGRVHRNDLMLDRGASQAITAYATTGVKAAEFLHQAALEVRTELASVEACLDFGCGYGRVTRYLAQRIHVSRITACDLDPEAVRFCASEFGVKGLRSAVSTQDVAFGQYDLVWMGSVLTHVNEGKCRELLSVLSRRLRPGGILAFSTHGHYSLTHLEAFGSEVARQSAVLLSTVATSGIAYWPYPHYVTGDYGLAWHSDAYILSLVSEIGSGTLELARTEASAWGLGRQDLWAFRRSAANQQLPVS